jgi:hypothetical protein
MFLQFDNVETIGEEEKKSSSRRRGSKTSVGAVKKKGRVKKSSSSRVGLKQELAGWKSMLSDAKNEELVAKIEELVDTLSSREPSLFKSGSKQQAAEGVQQSRVAALQRLCRRWLQVHNLTSCVLFLIRFCFVFFVAPRSFATARSARCAGSAACVGRVYCEREKVFSDAVDDCAKVHAADDDGGSSARHGRNAGGSVWLAAGDQRPEQSALVQTQSGHKRRTVDIIHRIGNTFQPTLFKLFINK